MARYCQAKLAITGTQCRWTTKRRCVAAAAAAFRGSGGDHVLRCAARQARSHTCCQCNSCRRWACGAIRERHSILRCCRYRHCISTVPVSDVVVLPRGVWYSSTSSSITITSSHGGCPSEGNVCLWQLATSTNFNRRRDAIITATNSLFLAFSLSLSLSLSLSFSLSLSCSLSLFRVLLSSSESKISHIDSQEIGIG